MIFSYNKLVCNNLKIVLGRQKTELKKYLLH